MFESEHATNAPEYVGRSIQQAEELAHGRGVADVRLFSDQPPSNSDVTADLRPYRLNLAVQAERVVAAAFF